MTCPWMRHAGTFAVAFFRGTHGTEALAGWIGRGPGAHGVSNHEPHRYADGQRTLGAWAAVVDPARRGPRQQRQQVDRPGNRERNADLARRAAASARPAAAAQLRR